jgi:hypothetical protein
MHRYAIILSALCAAVSLSAAPGCDRSRVESTGGICCDESAAAVFLASKLDDDDGDGSPLDEDFPRIDDEDDDIADHAWIMDDRGLYHLFFQTEDHGSGSFIEHYVTSGFEGLRYVGPALRPNPDGWDSYSLWAPHVIRSGKTYYMFYTGTDGPAGDPGAKQRIGLATSTDLLTWTRSPVNRCPGTSGDGCVYECSECWTTWGGPVGSFNQQCRDPFVIRDDVRDRWLMFATAKSVNGYGVVTVARSPDLRSWRGAGFIDATRRLEDGTDAQTTGGQAENPFVVRHDGAYYLLFTDWQDPEDSVTTAHPRTIVQYATSSTLDADTSGSAVWTYRGYTPDPGVNAIEVIHVGRDVWIMSESISNERSGLWARRRELRLRGIVWGPGFAFDASNVNLRCGPAYRSIDPLSVEAPAEEPIHEAVSP